MNTRLTRSQHDRMIGGVCGGLGRYLQIDPVLVRLAFVLFTLAGGAGVLAYLILLVVMPLDTTDETGVHYDAVDRQQRNALLVGGGMILVGVWYLIGKIPALAWLQIGNMWPLLLIIAGVVMIAGYLRSKEI